jgi:hypothetical protein
LTEAAASSAATFPHAFPFEEFAEYLQFLLLAWVKAID